MTKQEIIQKLSEGFNIVETSINHSAIDIFYQKKEKWSAAQNIQHLILSVKPLNLAFTLPNFALLFFGKLNRSPRNYEEMVEKYHQKLAEGNVPTGQFTPKEEDINKDELLKQFRTVNDTFLKKVDEFSEEDLDKYLLPHPLLGKLTLREMLYFTIYHTLHHYKAILFQLS
ncbi:DinB family protein [Arcicella sp. LKC2W]|uniref:DinB family protein n=1 Tax=Arcicella sp. LKC2W TaxID=2984198 RepID=UPI002B21381D|nr:DinB family protein [Arcicella sp. LKC2W]MEA5460163.1 DinB family protein [Arcicella sp. LKC2W]